jgi:hypothetical protein
MCVAEREKLRAARGRAAVPAVVEPVSAADCALPGASKSHAARGRSVPAASVPTAESALPGAYKFRAARGRAVLSSVPAAADDDALPGEMKSRRGRIAEVPVADCALPGVRKYSSTRGRQIVPDAPDAPDVPAAADVLQVAHTELSGLHKLCAAHDHKVSVDTDNASSTQLSTNGITPLTDRKYRCTHCASLGQCKKHCFTKRRRLTNVATKKSSGGSREPVDA